MYDRKKCEIMKNFQRHYETGGRFSLTLDAWTASNSSPYLGITIHFIDEYSWTATLILLSFLQLHGSHTVDNLSTIIRNSLVDFKIESSIHSITADSASINTAYFNILEHYLPRFSVLDCHVQCIAYIINLAA